MNSTNGRILLVDDTVSIHEDFRKILTARAASPLDSVEAALFGSGPPPMPAGFELDSAWQGEEGLAMVEAALAEGRPYALAFVDMRMPPGWDGIETVQRLWQADPLLQVVICTAYADHPWDQALARLETADRLLVLKKPFDAVEVSQLAATLTAKWSLARRAQARMDQLEATVRELRATESALRRANQELEGFAHSISHDLRSPLIVVGAFGKLLATELDGHANPKVRHYLERVQAGAVQGEELIEGLLRLTRIAQARLSPQAVDLSAMARRLLDDRRAADPQRHARLRIQDGLSAHGDPRLLHIVMTQLLDNAWKFTARKACAEIEVGSDGDSPQERGFFVRDNGEGFDMAHADKLFRNFQRLHAAGDFPGNGIGMVAASRVLSRHGGRIWADAQPGHGAVFHFTLPHEAAA